MDQVNRKMTTKCFHSDERHFLLSGLMIQEVNSPIGLEKLVPFKIKNHKFETNIYKT